MQPYTIGLIIGIVIAVIIGLVFLFVSASSKAKVQNTWNERMNVLNKNTIFFNRKLAEVGFNVDLKISTKAYHHTPNLHEIFNFCVDYKNKKIAACSFEDNEFKPLIMSFDEIGSFKIINGISNSTSQSFTSGGAVGAYGVVGGAASTTTYNEKTLEQVKLRIDPADELRPAVLIMMFTYQVDTSSDMHRILVDAMEQVDSVLTKIINSNKKESN